MSSAAVVISALRVKGNRIYSAVRQGFSLSRMTTNNLISPTKICYNSSFTLP